MCGVSVQRRGFPFVEGVFFGLEELREWNCLRQMFDVIPRALGFLRPEEELRADADGNRRQRAGVFRVLNAEGLYGV